MDYMQAYGSVEAYEAENEIVEDEMVNEAIYMINNQYHDHGAVTEGCIKNLAKGSCIKLFTQYDWRGINKEPYPDIIDRYCSANFVHSAHCGSHSEDEAAVVYYDERGLGWLLAWSVKDNSRGCNSHNKVYVETGPIRNYENINWYAIRTKLEASCDTSYYVDGTTANEAFAKISDGKRASLIATFKYLG